MNARSWVAVVMLVGGAAACGRAVFRAPNDEAPWLGIAETPRTRTYLHSAALADSGRTIVATIRVVFKTGARFGPFSERHTTAAIDCGNRVAQVLRELHIGGTTRTEQSVPTGLNDRPRSFDQYGETYGFVPVCLRLGRPPGQS